MPPGFRRDHFYQIVSGYFPNGSQRFHYMVINESGQTIPMDAEGIIVLDPLTEGYRGAALGGGGGTCPPAEDKCRPFEFSVEHPFPVESRVWTVTWDWLEKEWEKHACGPTFNFRRLAKDITTYDSNWEVMLPHRIRANPSESSVVVMWSYPVKGTLVFSIAPSYTHQSP